jgi:tripartite-type tricarboxylate transporter receptor subunit TctC
MKPTTMFKWILFLSSLSAYVVHAQTVESPAAYPSRQIQLVVPYAPGGGLDTVMRQVAPRMSALLKQQIVVENKPGGATVIATDHVVKARPDGYTLLATGAPISLNQALGLKVPYDPLRDLEPIGLLVTLPGLILVSPQLSVKNMKQLVEMAKSKPGAMSFGSAGLGSIGHLGGALFAARAGISMQHIGYKGSAPALTDLLGGQIPVLIDAMIPSGAQVKAGRVIALAIANSTRSPLLPDVPTAAEAGYPGVEFAATFGMMAPARTPPEIVAKVNQSLVEVLKMPDVRKQLIDMGYEVVGNSPAEYRAFIRSEIDTWTRIVRDNGIKMD